MKFSQMIVAAAALLLLAFSAGMEFANVKHEAAQAAAERVEHAYRDTLLEKNQAAADQIEKLTSNLASEKSRAHSQPCPLPHNPTRRKTCQ